MTAGMGVAFSNVRERILSMDVTHRIQLNAEELRLHAELKRSRGSELALKEEVAKIKAELEQADQSRSVITKNETLHATKDDMEQKIKDLEEKDRFAQGDIASFKRQVRFLKRKRKDNIPLLRVFPLPPKFLLELSYQRRQRPQNPQPRLPDRILPLFYNPLPRNLGQGRLDGTIHPQYPLPTT
jgi:hypothetical protein